MSRYAYEEKRTSTLEVAPGVELKVEAWIEGWQDRGDIDSPPDGEEQMEVTAVELHAFGQVVDLLELWNVHGDGDLDNAVEEAIERI